MDCRCTLFVFFVLFAVSTNLQLMMWCLDFCLVWGRYAEHSFKLTARFTGTSSLWIKSLTSKDFIHSCANCFKSLLSVLTFSDASSCINFFRMYTNNAFPSNPPSPYFAHSWYISTGNSCAVNTLLLGESTSTPDVESSFSGCMLNHDCITAPLFVIHAGVSMVTILKFKSMSL